MKFSIDPHALYRVPDLCNIFGMSDQVVRALLRQKQLKATKLGKHWFVTGEEIKRHFNLSEGNHGPKSIR
jgi:hypothetical protein